MNLQTQFRTLKMDIIRKFAHAGGKHSSKKHADKVECAHWKLPWFLSNSPLRKKHQGKAQLSLRKSPSSSRLSPCKNHMRQNETKFLKIAIFDQIAPQWKNIAPIQTTHPLSMMKSCCHRVNVFAPFEDRKFLWDLPIHFSNKFIERRARAAHSRAFQSHFLLDRAQSEIQWHL